MGKDQISVSFECKRCGTKLSWRDDIGDFEMVACSKCGASVGTYGELKKTAVDGAKKKIEGMLKGAFKRLR